jgi:AcrR family transcriptional regulator
MPPARHPSPPRQPRRRADAQRSVARILDAAVDALASDPEASMAEIARQAGVVRATIYVHFPTRESLLEAVTERAISEVTRVIEAAEPQRGEAADALGRVVTAAWRALGRFHALVAVNTRLPHDELHRRHRPLLSILEPLIERGQRDGTFRPDVPYIPGIEMNSCTSIAPPGVWKCGWPFRRSTAASCESASRIEKPATSPSALAAPTIVPSPSGAW